MTIFNSPHWSSHTEEGGVGRGQRSEFYHCNCANDDDDDADDDNDYNDADDINTWTTGLVPIPRAEPLLCRDSGERAWS